MTDFFSITYRRYRTAAGWVEEFIQPFMRTVTDETVRHFNNMTTTAFARWFNNNDDYDYLEDGNVPDSDDK